MLQFENELKCRRKLDYLLRAIVKETGQIPSAMIIRDVTRSGSDPVAGGGFADVWGGMQGNINVALKVLRIFNEGGFNIRVRFTYLILLNVRSF